MPLVPDIAWQHFVLIFQDETIEVIAESCTSRWFDRSDLLPVMLELLLD